MIKILTFFLLVLLPAALSAQNTSGIQEAAKEYALANVNEDYDALIYFTYPYVLEKSGGKEGLLKALADSYDLMKMRDMKWESFEIGEPLKVAKAGPEIHALVPVTSTIIVPKGEIITHITLIAVLQESSDHWYFIEATGLEPRTIHNYLPTWDYTLGLNFESSKEFIPRSE